MLTKTNIEPFLIQSTTHTPAISFVPDNLYFNIVGIASFPQSVQLFSNAARWITEYDLSLDLRSQVNKDKSLHLTFEFNILVPDNESLDAMKNLFTSLERMNRMNNRRVYVSIKWHYHSENENIKIFLWQCIDRYRVFFETINEMGAPSFYIQPTNVTPEIFFDTPNHVFRITGSSRPEHPDAFYDKVIKWIECNGRQWMSEYPLNIKMYYFNTSSGKTLLNILKYMDKWYSEENRGTINWYYSGEYEYDEVREEFEPYLQNISFNYIQYNQ